MDRDKCFRCMTSDEDFGCSCARELERYQKKDLTEREKEMLNFIMSVRRSYDIREVS